MKAAQLIEKKNIKYTDVDDPKMGDNDVLIKVKATGICGSDVPRVLGDAAHFYPIILGHEFSGEVIDSGKNIESFGNGQRVAGVPLIPCLKCGDCLKGDYSLCKNYTFIGSRISGSFAEYISVPAKNAVKFNDNISFEQGAFFEPSTVALHGLLRVDYKGGGHVAILGGGTIGLFTAQWARIFGAKSVTVFDVVDERLQLAKDMGVTNVVNSSTDCKEEIADITSGKGFDYVYETAGLNITMSLAFQIAANKSNVCFIGTSHTNLQFDYKLFELMNRKEFILTGSWMSYSSPFPGKEWELTAHYFSSGDLLFNEDLIYKKYPLSNTADAFALYENPKNVKGKLLIVD